MKTEGRSTSPVAANDIRAVKTVSGSQGLSQATKLIFETGTPHRTGVDLPEPNGTKSRLGKHARTGEIGLPGLSEPETLRHYVRLSQKNYAIDLGVYPLGSCTMKHNPRLNEKVARMPGFGDVHPLQPTSTVQGTCLLYTSPSPRDGLLSRMPSSA